MDMPAAKDENRVATRRRITMPAHSDGDFARFQTVVTQETQHAIGRLTECVQRKWAPFGAQTYRIDISVTRLDDSGKW